MKKCGEEVYELSTLDGMPVLFTSGRIERKSVPEHLHCYDVRHDDECQGIASQIKPYVLVNHWGTILTRQEIPLQEGSYYPEEGLNFTGWPMTLSEYESMSEEQFMELVAEETNGMQMNL